LSPVSDEATDCISISSSSSTVLVNSLFVMGLSINSVIRIDGPLDESEELDVVDDV
jgi:hypothetical protein